MIPLWSNDSVHGGSSTAGETVLWFCASELQCWRRELHHSFRPRLQVSVTDALVMVVLCSFMFPCQQSVLQELLFLDWLVLLPQSEVAVILQRSPKLHKIGFLPLMLFFISSALMLIFLIKSKNKNGRVSFNVSMKT